MIIVPLEAAASGLPILASPRAGATLDPLQDGESGLIRDSDNIEGMAAAIKRLADGVALRERLGRAARAATKDYTQRQRRPGTPMRWERCSQSPTSKEALTAARSS